MATYHEIAKNEILFLILATEYLHFAASHSHCLDFLEFLFLLFFLYFNFNFVFNWAVYAFPERARLTLPSA